MSDMIRTLRLVTAIATALCAWILYSYVDVASTLTAAPPTSKATVAAPAALPVPVPPRRGLRVLMGIFTADFPKEVRYRQRHRDLFALWNDTRVCPLHEYKRMGEEERNRCELTYTFIMGTARHFTFETNNTNTTGATPTAGDLSKELTDESLRPLEVTARPVQNAIGSDVNNPDTVILNIRENMDDGKSPTWWYFASKLATELDLDYITKCDSDSILSLHDFFRHAYRNWPPAPYNAMTLIGVPTNKNHWPKKELFPEPFFDKYYNHVHIYCSGQLYTMSTDLAVAVGAEARRLGGNCTYCGHYEDHDMSTMAYYTTGPVNSNVSGTADRTQQQRDTDDPMPIKLVMMGSHHKYWEHDVKEDDTPFRRIWAREQARMARQSTFFDNEHLHWTPPRGP